MSVYKKQAVDLVNKFYFKLSNNGSLDIGVNNCTQRLKEAKECALISINEMIKQNGELYLKSLGGKTIAFYKAKNDYLFQLKTEIENL